VIDAKLKLTDLKWSGEGDFIMENGDIADTNNNTGLAFLQEVEERVKSGYRDWKLNELKGAGVDEYEGEINNIETQREIQNSIEYAFTKDGFLDRQDFEVTAAPISVSQVAVRIDFDTSLTDVVPDSTILVKVVYDTQGKGPFIVR
jgi:hypothetical protein